jgi:DME family drug/metabolite transporter
MIGSAFALFSAAASGLAVVLVGKHSRKSNAFNVSLIISCVGLAILWPLAVILTDFEAANFEGFVLFATAGVLTPGLVRLFYYSGLKKLGTSVNSSIFSVYPLYSAILALFFLSETLSLGNWSGIFCVILGCFFVEASSREINREHKSYRKGLIFPIIGGLTLGVSAVIRKAALDFYDAPVLGVAIGYSFSLLTYALILMSSQPTREKLSLKQDFRLFWKAGIGQALSWVFSFYALSYEQVSVVTPLLAVEPLFVASFASLYLREFEHVSFKLAASIILTVFGVVLVVI